MTKKEDESRQPPRPHWSSAAFQPPEATPGEGFGYDPLEEFGASYESSMSEIHRCGLRAQKVGALTPERRQAWRKLRDTEKRLMVDLLYLQPHPEVCGPALQIPKRLQPPLPQIAPPEAPQILAAIGELPLPPPPQPLFEGEAPPLRADLWKLLEEALGDSEPDLPPLAQPESFLEEE